MIALCNLERAIVPESRAERNLSLIAAECVDQDALNAKHAGASVDFGTVAPAFGQAGGGVEAYFVNAVPNAMVPPAPVTKLPDE